MLVQCPLSDCTLLMPLPRKEGRGDSERQEQDKRRRKLDDGFSSMVLGVWWRTQAYLTETSLAKVRMRQDLAHFSHSLQKLSAFRRGDSQVIVTKLAWVCRFLLPLEQGKTFRFARLTYRGIAPVFSFITVRNRISLPRFAATPNSKGLRHGNR